MTEQMNERMSKRNRAVVLVLVLALVVAGAAAVAAKKREVRQLAAPPPVPLPVQTARVTSGAAAQTIETAAVVRADSASVVAAQIGGTILEMRVREGDLVRGGDLLARIDARPLADAVGAAEARVAAARQARTVQESIFKRDQALLGGGAISQQALDLSSAQLESARANEIAAERAVSTAHVQSSYSAVRAPYSGVVTSRMAEPGDLASPGKPLYVVDRPGDARVISKLSQDSLRLLHPGADATFTSGDATLHARITRIYPALDATFLGEVETLVPRSPFGLPNGAAIHAVYSAEPVSGLTVPNEALLDGTGGTVVVRVMNGRSEPTPVRVVARGAQRSVVEGSVGPDDVVVIGLPSELMALTQGTPIAPVTGRE